MGRLLVIVARGESARYAYLKHVFASDTVEIIVDRRHAVRRREDSPPAVDRRRGDRRHRNVDQDLRTLGWALVRR